MKRTRKRESSIVEKVFVQSFFTTVLSTMAFCIGPMIDGMMIGNFMPVESVAAYGLVSPSIFVFSMVGAVIAGGARNIVSRLRMFHEDHKEQSHNTGRNRTERCC